MIGAARCGAADGDAVGGCRCRRCRRRARRRPAACRAARPGAASGPARYRRPRTASTTAQERPDQLGVGRGQRAGRTARARLAPAPTSAGRHRGPDRDRDRRPARAPRRRTGRVAPGVRQLGGVAVEGADRLGAPPPARLRDAAGRCVPSGRRSRTSAPSPARTESVRYSSRATTPAPRARATSSRSRARAPRRRLASPPRRTGVIEHRGIGGGAGVDAELHHAVGRERNPGEPGAVGPDPHRLAVDREPASPVADRAEEKAGVRARTDRVGRRDRSRGWPSGPRTAGTAGSAASARGGVDAGGRRRSCRRRSGGGRRPERAHAARPSSRAQRAGAASENHGCKVHIGYDLRQADVDALGAAPRFVTLRSHGTWRAIRVTLAVAAHPADGQRRTLPRTRDHGRPRVRLRQDRSGPHPRSQRGHLPRRRSQHRQRQPPARRARATRSGPRGSLFMVADGMGGAAAGELASAMAADLIYRHLATAWASDAEVDRRPVRLPDAGGGRARQRSRSTPTPGSIPKSGAWAPRSPPPACSATISISPRSATAGPTSSGTARRSSSPRTSRSCSGWWTRAS